MNTSQRPLNSPSESDIELLSAYLDDQLGAAERASLDRRIGAEPDLRAELEEMRATVVLLRNLEPQRPPRSFTLDPATAPRRRRILPLAWAMQLGGGLAGLALVLMASLQMIGGVSGGTAAAPASPAAMMAAAEPTPAPAAAAPMSAAAAATQAPSATGAPFSAAAPAAAPSDAATADPAGAAMAAPAPLSPDAARQASPADAASDSAPTPEIAASGSSSPGTGDPGVAGAAAKSAPQLSGPPAGIIFGLGIVLIALALGSFLYTRR